MKIKRRKHPNCLNCGYKLSKEDNFCPNCGQENTDNDAGIGLLVRDFTSNFFSLDSRFGRTLAPFLFKPGKITVEFNEGKRVKYANPIRWYLVISIVHFFFFMKSFEPDVSSGNIILNEEGVELTKERFDSLYYLPDSLHSQDSWPVSDHYFMLIDELNKNSNLKTAEILDSLKLNELPWLSKLVVKQTIKINKDPSGSLQKYVLSQIPAIMFFILPIYAFILKVFFWKKGKYIRHLIHSLHIHSFVFFLFTIGWIMMWIGLPEDSRNMIQGIGFLIATIYILFSFKKVYDIKWGTATWKLVLIGFVYTIAMTLSLVAGTVISLAFY